MAYIFIVIVEGTSLHVFYVFLVFLSWAENIFIQPVYQAISLQDIMEHFPSFSVAAQ